MREGWAHVSMLFMVASDGIISTSTTCVVMVQTQTVWFGLAGKEASLTTQRAYRGSLCPAP